MYGEFCAKLADQIERGAQLVKQWCKRLKMRSKMDAYAGPRSPLSSGDSNRGPRCTLSRIGQVYFDITS